MQKIIGIFSIVVFIIGIGKITKEIINFNPQDNYKKEINKIDQEKNYLTINDENFYYKVYEDEELKNLAMIITKDCNNRESCEIDKIFKYVTDKPYENQNKNYFKSPEEVIENGGDCDEKAYLMASLLNMTGNKSIMIYTDDHAFIGVKIKSIADVYPNTKKIQIGNELYYYAETTAKGAYIGWDNGVNIQDIKMIYHVNEKREIKKSEIQII